MALFPDSIPADTDPVKLGAAAIRALKTALNTVFSPFLNDDGTFKNNVVTGAALVDGTVAQSKMAANVLVQTGTVLMFAGGTAPVNFVLCDGSNYDGTSPTYAALFALIGTTYGNSGGASHFNVPDLRGRTAVMPDGGAGRATSISGLGTVDGASSVTLTAAQSGVPAHTHDPKSPSTFFLDVVVSGGAGTTVGGTVVVADTTTGPVTGGPQAASSAHPNLQPSIGINYIIKL